MIAGSSSFAFAVSSKISGLTGFESVDFCVPKSELMNANASSCFGRPVFFFVP